MYQFQQHCLEVSYHIKKNLKVNFRDNTCKGTFQGKKNRERLMEECNKFGIQSQRLLPFTILLSVPEGLLGQVQCPATVHWKLLTFPFSLQQRGQAEQL